MPQVLVPTPPIHLPLPGQLLSPGASQLPLQVLCPLPLYPSGIVCRCTLQLFHLTADLVVCRFGEIQVTDPRSQTNGVLRARIDTRIKLHITFPTGFPVQFLKLPKTPSVHEDSPQPEQTLKFSLELRGAGSESIIEHVCSKCKERKSQATWDIVDFRGRTTIIAIENQSASIEFFIKCYAKHHRPEYHAFR